jgi:hypothetical protein
MEVTNLPQGTWQVLYKSVSFSSVNCSVHDQNFDYYLIKIPPSELFLIKCYVKNLKQWRLTNI